MIARAPLRVSFGGGGTDLAAYYERYGGLVVSAAIARYSYVVARQPAGGGIGINSADYRTWESFPPGQIPPVADPLKLPKAAIERFAEGGLDAGIELFLASEVAPGSGLGSSSAMAVALVRAVAAYEGRRMGTGEVAELASELEIERLGMPIGKQDQYASAFGGLNVIAFRAAGVTVTPLALPAEVVTGLRARLVLFSTGKTHDSGAILGEVRDQAAAGTATVEGLHRLKGLAEEMADALGAGDLDRFGGLLDEGWRHKRRLSTGVSTEAIDRWYAAAREAGALGGKITGAGGGGFLLLYCPPEAQPMLRSRLDGLGLRELPFDFDFEGAQVLTGATERLAGEDRRA